MFDIARTEELRSIAVLLLEQHQQALEREPANFAFKLQVKSSLARVEELTNRLIEQKTTRQFDLLEIRLFGESAVNGTLPLHMIGQLTLAFEETLVEIGKFAQYGSRRKRNAVAETRELLKPKLKRLGVGSTRLFVSMDARPDMYGNTLSEVCISRTFELFTADNADTLLEKTATVGKPALRNLNRFLKSLLNFNLEVDFNWHTPLDTELNWRGNKIALQKLQSSLELITQNDPFEITIEGELVTQSIKGDGKFEILTDSGITIAGSVPLDVLTQFIQVRIGSYCKATIVQTIISNEHTGSNRSVYELKSIEPREQGYNQYKSQIELIM